MLLLVLIRSFFRATNFQLLLPGNPVNFMLASYGGASVRKFNFKRLALRIVAFQSEDLPSRNESDILPKHLNKITHFDFFPSLFPVIEAR